MQHSASEHTRAAADGVCERPTDFHFQPTEFYVIFSIYDLGLDKPVKIWGFQFFLGAATAPGCCTRGIVEYLG